MRIFYQISFFILTALIAATSFECLSVTTMIVTVTEWKIFILTANAIVITTCSNVTITANTENSLDYMIISMTNIYKTQLSISFLSNVDVSFSVDNSSIIVLLNTSLTQYTFSTEWTDRIYVESNLNSLSSKIGNSFTDSFDIDISYVNDYSVFITCSSQDISIIECNIDLFKQSDIQCNKLVDDSVCLNLAQNILNESASFFFATCADMIYIYSNDNKTNVSNLKSKLISCCIDVMCKTSSRQFHKQYNALNAKSSIVHHQ